MLAIRSLTMPVTLLEGQNDGANDLYDLHVFRRFICRDDRIHVAVYCSRPHQGLAR